MRQSFSFFCEHIKKLELATKPIVELMPDLVGVKGGGVLHAARRLAEAGDVRRVWAQHAVAMVAGGAPIERSVAKRRQLNLSVASTESLHVVRCGEETKGYIDKKRREGKTGRAAVRRKLISPARSFVSCSLILLSFGSLDLVIQADARFTKYR